MVCIFLHTGFFGEARYLASIMGASRASFHLIASSMLAIISIAPAQGFGTMGPLAPMWGQYDAVDNVTALGTYHMCVIQAGTLFPYCAGDMSRNASVHLVDPPKDTPFLALSAGAQFTCGLVFETQVPVCWGDLENSTLLVPDKFKNVSYSIIASGAYHVCALRSHDAATIDCWGEGSHGEIDPPPNKGPYLSLTSGWDFSCALDSLGRAVCWGFFINDTFTHNLAQPNKSLDAIVAGGSYACGLEKKTGSTTCWGDNIYSQSNVPPYENFKAISPSMYHTCGLRGNDGAAACWGDNYYNQLNTTPVGVAFGTLASGDFYTCGVTEKLAVMCWGNARSGTKDFSNIKVAPTVCTKNCETNQYQVASDVCPGIGYKACVDCTTDLCSTTKSHTRTIVVTTVVILSVVISVAILFAVLEKRRKMLASRAAAEEIDLEFVEWKNQAKRVKAFTKLELRAATGNFSNEMVVGKGAFGMVYKGTLSDGTIVAIKKKKLGKTASFGAELKLLSRLHHTNLVNLVGYCKEEVLLVFEYMANGSLHDCLFTKNIKLSWFTRLKIATQAAHGLEYLHIFADPTIIHRDVKSSNILLDDDFNAHVADFGASTLGPALEDTHVTSTSLVGTPGYLDPEYFQTMHLSPKSDVYSFGVVILELLTGRKALDLKQTIVGVVPWVERMAADSSLAAALLSDLAVDDDKSHILVEVLELALLCVRPSAVDRPTMSEVAHALEKAMKDFGNAGARSEAPSSPWTECTSGPSGTSTMEGPSTLEASFSSSLLAEFRALSPK